MLGAFANAFRTPDLRRKLLFVLFIIVLFRLGSQVPAPGVNVANVQACFRQIENDGLYGLINLFSGGALLQLTVFALGIMPYITASIILQLLVVVIPRLEALKKEGQAGQTKITQYTRYLTLGLAVLQATGIVALARNGALLQGCTRDLLHDDGTAFVITPNAPADFENPFHVYLFEAPHLRSLLALFFDDVVVPKANLVQAFDEMGSGRDRPHYGQLTVCVAEDEAQARKTAHKVWPIAGLKGELTAELPLPAHNRRSSTQEDDPQNSIQQVVDIRRAMDFLLSQPYVDPDRFGYVGHDFGGMYGVLWTDAIQGVMMFVVESPTRSISQATLSFAAPPRTWPNSAKDRLMKNSPAPVAQNEISLVPGAVVVTLGALLDRAEPAALTGTPLSTPRYVAMVPDIVASESVCVKAYEAGSLPSAFIV